jgi:hypothetical protein
MKFGHQTETAETRRFQRFPGRKLKGSESDVKTETSSPRQGYGSREATPRTRPFVPHSSREACACVASWTTSAVDAGTASDRGTYSARETARDVTDDGGPEFAGEGQIPQAGHVASSSPPRSRCDTASDRGLPPRCETTPIKDSPSPPTAAPTRGGEAIPQLARLWPAGAPIARSRAPFPRTADRAYRWVARHRERLGRVLGERACAVDPADRDQ